MERDNAEKNNRENKKNENDKTDYMNLGEGQFRKGNISANVN